MGRSFHTRQGRVAPGTEGGVAGLAAKRLDALGLAMLAIPDQSMNVGICDSGIRARSVGAGEAFGVHSFGSTSAAFDLAPGPHRRRRWLYTRRGSGGETTGGAIVWRAGLEQTVGSRVHGSSW